MNEENTVEEVAQENCAPACCESACESMGEVFAEETVQPGIGLRFDKENNLIAIGIILPEGSAAIGISLEEAVSLKANLEGVIKEFQDNQVTEAPLDPLTP